MNIKQFIVLGVLLAVYTSAYAQKEAVDSHKKPETPILDDPYKKDTRVIQAPVGGISTAPPKVNPPKPTKFKVRVMDYVVPGIQAIMAAKRHGFTFAGEEECKYDGADGWMIQPDPNRGMYCKMKAFYHSRMQSGCHNLKEGWSVKDMNFSGIANPHVPYTEETPAFYFSSENNTSGLRRLTLRSITLVGPVGHNYEHAFTRCN